jgi:hypothetical protein
MIHELTGVLNSLAKGKIAFLAPAKRLAMRLEPERFCPLFYNEVFGNS